MDEDDEEIYECSPTSSRRLNLYDLSFIDPRCYTQLYHACKTNDIQIAKAEIKKGVNLNAVDNQCNTYLHVAVKHCSLDVVRLLLAQRKVRVDVQNFIGDTPLHLSRNVPIIKQLIAAGCDLNIRNSYYNSPILNLLSYHNAFTITYDVLKVLLEHGANPNTTDLREMTAFYNIMYRQKFNNDEVYQLFSLLLRYDGDVNLKIGYLSDSSFMYAVRKCSDEVIDLLLPYVTDINEVSAKTKYSVLMCAMARSSDSAFKFIKLGADIDYCNGSNSCLLLSLRYKDPRIFKYIWRICDKSYVLYKQKNFLRTFLNSHIFGKDDFLESLHLILDSAFATDLMAEAVPFGIYEDLIAAFSLLHIRSNDRVKVIHMFLNRSKRICVEDLFEVYRKYGFNEELEAFLTTTVEILNFVPFSNFITRLCCPYYNFNLSKYTTKAKSLLELSRDAVRKNIRPIEGNVYFKYYNQIHSLDIPHLLKDIICLKRPIHPMEEFIL